MRNIVVLILTAGFVLSCAQPKARRPVSHTGKTDFSRSVEFNKKLSEWENKAFQRYMSRDTAHTYLNSHHGFWYAYLHKIHDDKPTPVKGQTVEFLYSVKALNGDTIYKVEDHGKKTYIVDKEDFMKGIQIGIKMMKENEKIRFLLPSSQAYGFTGDRDKIGMNTPLIVEVELLSISSD